jgi:hypothetical protein
MEKVGRGKLRKEADLKKNEGTGGENGVEEADDLADDYWAIRGIEGMLFGGQPLYPTFRLRAVAFLPKGEDCLGGGTPPDDDRLVLGEGERGAIIAAFREAFPDGGGAAPNARNDAYVVSGMATVEAPDVAKAWNGAVGRLLFLLSESAAVRDAEAALKELDFLHVEATEEGFEELVGRALLEEGREDA